MPADWYPPTGSERAGSAPERGLSASPRVSVRPSARSDRGVFATQAIAAGELVERVPVVVFAADEWRHVIETSLNDYCFRWGADDEEGAFALGFGALYNHSFHPNARYVLKLQERCIDFVALREIADGEEVLVNYNRDPDDLRPVWFEPAP
jgi:SET domain-containing protein